MTALRAKSSNCEEFRALALPPNCNDQVQIAKVLFYQQEIIGTDLLKDIIMSRNMLISIFSITSENIYSFF